MKKPVLVILTLAVLVTLTYVADRATKGDKPTVKAGSPAATAKSDDTAAAPEVSAKDLQDHDVRLADFRGKVVLVNFWATWCGPCRIEIPWLIEFQEKYGPRGFTVLGLAMDEEGKKAVEPFVIKERFDVNGQPVAMNYPILLGSDAIADKFGGLIGLPTSVLISRDGKVVKRIVGLVNHEELVRAIEGQL